MAELPGKKLVIQLLEKILGELGTQRGSSWFEFAQPAAQLTDRPSEIVIPLVHVPAQIVALEEVLYAAGAEDTAGLQLAETIIELGIGSEFWPTEPADGPAPPTIKFRPPQLKESGVH